ncbi:sulfotransferase 1B1-like [Narcine bancroftii]|uniref:sulfotransferase 1B1-like n=1 Tax=Narcine bancroftii TaxID=1343680 RepID=UPI00383145F2
MAATPQDSRPILVPLRDVPMPDIFLDEWEEVDGFQAHPSDLLVATYPKAGTTWVQEIVDSILHDGVVSQCDRGPMPNRIPFLEFKERGKQRPGMQKLREMPPPRVIKTHLPFSLLPKSFLEQRCKVIYCARNAQDVMVSFFHFDRMNKLQPEPGSWAEYFLKFITGNVSYGPWHKHVRGWWEQRMHYPILYLFYEDLKEDLNREVRKVMKFLGREISNEAVASIVKHTSFESMKENPACNYSNVPSSIFDTNTSVFMRKGQVGDWKNHFTIAQAEVFDAVYRRWMEGSDLQFRTQL